MNPTSDALRGREIIVEFIPVGSYMRVSAMDAASLVEITVQGPLKAPRSILKANALKRLEYVMRKNGVIE